MSRVAIVTGGASGMGGTGSTDTTVCPGAPLTGETAFA